MSRAAPHAAPFPDAERVLELTVPLSLPRTLSIHYRGRGDPTMRFEVSGSVWRATRTEEGPVTLFVEQLDGRVRARAWGPGSALALGRLDAFLGLDDEPWRLEPLHRAVADAARRLHGMRIGRSGAVLEALVPAILEQKITGDEARRVWRNLIRAHGEDAPGPPGMRLPPAPETLARLPYYAYHPLGLERRRADLVRAVAREARRLEGLVALATGLDRDPEAAYRALRAFPGIGPWTAAEVGVRAFGDPDAVSVGDYHLPSVVTWALAGEPTGTDERMLELLEPYRGQRGRVTRLLELSGSARARRAPRMPSRSIARL
jgi:3-methyladenine DNA glycosylase/8-oxoguanine DNA glycosylase